MQELSGTPLAPWKPVTGDNLFTRESGAVAAQFHDPPAIEPYASELVGAERGIVLGKKSGLDSIRIKVAELGLDVPEERYPALLESVKRAGTKKRGLVTDAEFRRLVNAEATTRSQLTDMSRRSILDLLGESRHEQEESMRRTGTWVALACCPDGRRSA